MSADPSRTSSDPRNHTTHPKLDAAALHRLGKDLQRIYAPIGELQLTECLADLLLQLGETEMAAKADATKR